MINITLIFNKKSNVKWKKILHFKIFIELNIKREKFFIYYDINSLNVLFNKV